MCGIAGAYSATGLGPDVQRRIVRMTDAIAHRGPDGDGVWLSQDGRCAFGHRRLAIIDPNSRSDQPFFSDDGRFALVFNGEIYNFIEVREELVLRGQTFRTESDTEVVLGAWREWGAEMLPRFNGMWALGIYDLAQNELFLARDRYGVKPLVIARRDEGIAFASEPRALVAGGWASGNLDTTVARRAVLDPLGVEGGWQTLRLGIENLPAGHWLRCSGTKIESARWWRSCDHLMDRPKSLTEAADTFRERFESAVRIRMRSDVPIGTCLSGGFDSSSIVAMMSQIAGDTGSSHERESTDWRHAFVASFPGMLNDETAEAREAARFAGIERPTILDFARDDPLDQIDQVMDALEVPFVSLPTAVWKTYAAVHAKGVPVSIDGHGADEIMGGYRQAGKGLAFRLSTLLGQSTGQGRVAAFASDAANVARLKATGLYFLRELEPPPRIPTPADNDPIPAEWSALDRRLYRMTHSTILPTLLRNFDRLSMAHSVEVRSPYLDWRLVQFVLSLDESMKNDDRYSKLVAREAMRGRMPESIRSATRKVGFGSQMPEWLNGRLGQWAAELLRGPNQAFDAMIDRKALRRKVELLTATNGWTWPNSTRLWPYVHLYCLTRGS